MKDSWDSKGSSPYQVVETSPPYWELPTRRAKPTKSHFHSHRLRANPGVSMGQVVRPRSLRTLESGAFRKGTSAHRPLNEPF